MKKSILLLSAYDARSHRQWRGSLAEMFPDYAWTQLSLPPRHFNWRIRGNSLSWGFGQRPLLTEKFDLLIATSMVDLSSLRGFVPPLAQIPTMVYCHENQFVYPASNAQYSSVEPRLTSLYTVLCADQVVFNSSYNRSTFIEGAEQLLNLFPDYVPAGLVTVLQQSRVIPVPLPSACQTSLAHHRIDSKPACLQVVWNHRWEYDKGPMLLLAIANAIAARSLPICLHVAGESFRRQPEEFQLVGQIMQQHCRRLKLEPPQFGFIPTAQDYYRLLSSCDVVLSTALHDFQGMAMLEAMTCGCTPLAPERLVYPEYLPPDCLYQTGNINVECEAIIEKLGQWWEILQHRGELPKVNASRFSPVSLKPEYANLFSELTD
ncbi:MAG: DUF3524 domain-containing protein [Pseudohongiellaceae bacterium]